MSDEAIVLGGGMTGLAAGVASGWPVYEAGEVPGGICSSYYIRPGEQTRLHQMPADGEAYRFEIGGGHWIFGGDPIVVQFIRKLVPLKSYARRSSVYFHEQSLYVPYPLQNSLRHLGPEVTEAALTEMARARGVFRTMRDWLHDSFGLTLSELFFDPFHELYTAGLYDRIAPQDAYKSPVDLGAAIRGAVQDTLPVGYNATFLYPDPGLDALARAMADRCQVHYRREVTRIDPQARTVYFSDGGQVTYESLLCTLPLNTTLRLAGLQSEQQNDPSTAVLVLNIGAERGPRCPEDHWLYNFKTRSGFHRVGFYSNVDRSFLPRSYRESGGAVTIYVERALQPEQRLCEADVKAYSAAVVAELQDWGYIGEPHVVDPTWIEVAYTWQWPASKWRSAAIKLLEGHGIYMVGRYARWTFQGIADSIRDGLFAGAALA